MSGVYRGNDGEGSENGRGGYNGKNSFTSYPKPKKSVKEMMVGKVVDTVSSAVKKQKDKKKINPTNDNH
jgi:hypothetical protein